MEFKNCDSNADKVKLYESLKKKSKYKIHDCPLTIGNFGFTSTNNAFLFLMNAILADVLCNFDVILLNSI